MVKALFEDDDRAMEDFKNLKKIEDKIAAQAKLISLLENEVLSRCQTPADFVATIRKMSF